MITIRKLPQAKEDLLDIWCYIASDNPVQADRYLDYLEAKLILLAATPGMGRWRGELGPGLLSFPAENYLIFYRQTDAGIDIVRVLHSARDIEPLLRNDRR